MTISCIIQWRPCAVQTCTSKKSAHSRGTNGPSDSEQTKPRFLPRLCMKVKSCFPQQHLPLGVSWQKSIVLVSLIAFEKEPEGRINQTGTFALLSQCTKHGGSFCLGQICERFFQLHKHWKGTQTAELISSIQVIGEHAIADTHTH